MLSYMWTKLHMNTSRSNWPKEMLNGLSERQAMMSPNRIYTIQLNLKSFSTKVLQSVQSNCMWSVVFSLTWRQLKSLYWSVKLPYSDALVTWFELEPNAFFLECIISQSTWKKDIRWNLKSLMKIAAKRTKSTFMNTKTQPRQTITRMPKRRWFQISLILG